MRSLNTNCLPFIALAALQLGLSHGLDYSTCRAGDWPQILGPSRNGKAAEDERFPGMLSNTLTTVWTAPLGSGHAGPIVVKEKVFLFHRDGKVERLEAFAVSTGKSLWKADFDARYQGGIDADKGPRCVPLASNGKIFVLGAAGDLHCVGLDGKKLWSRELFVDYEGDEGYFGAGSTPILVGGALLVNVGGPGAGIVALSPDRGETLWKATNEGASYSSPAVTQLENQEQAIFVTRLNCVAVNPKTGAAKILFPFGKRGPTVNAATPLIFDGKLFVTASYGVGASLRKLSFKVEETWGDDDTLSSQYNTPVEHKGYLYGIHGREDAGPAALRCVNAASGKVQWTKDDFGVAHAVLAGDSILFLGNDGKATLIAADPAGYRLLGETELAKGTTRAMPAYSGGRLYFRTTTGGRGELKCFALGP